MSLSAMRRASWRWSRSITGAWNCAFVRSTGQTGTHLLYFPDEQALDAFRTDSARLVLADEWNDAARSPRFNSLSGLPKADLDLSGAPFDHRSKHLMAAAK